MNEERDQRLAKLFESTSVELNDEEFAANLRRRIHRQANVARLRKVALLAVVIALGALVSGQMNDGLAAAQASIEQVVNRYLQQYPHVTTIGKGAVVSFTVLFFALRSIRRWSSH